MRKTMTATLLGVGLVVAGPSRLLLGAAPAVAQSPGGGGGFHGGGGGGFHGGGGGGFHGGGGFSGGAGFHGGGGFNGGAGFRGTGYGGGSYGAGSVGYHGGGYVGDRGGYGHHGGYGYHDHDGYRGGYGYRGSYYGGFGGYYGGFGGYYGGLGYGCCGYGYYDGAGFLLGAAAVAGVTALAVESAYDRPYYDGYYVESYAPPPPVVAYAPPPAVYEASPATYRPPVGTDRASLIDRCARAAEADARSFASEAKFVRTETFDRDGPSAHIEGVLDVTRNYGGRYDRDGFPLSNDQAGRTQVRFTCSLDAGHIVGLKIDR